MTAVEELREARDKYLAACQTGQGQQFYEQWIAAVRRFNRENHPQAEAAHG